MYKRRIAFITLLTLYVFITAGVKINPSPVSITEEKQAGHDGLYNTILHMDSVMFDAFNAHDLEKLKTTFSNDLEFYHDNGGLTNYQETMENFQKLFEKNKSTGLRRDMIQGSLEVYPIKNFGAVEICRHRFCHIENSKNDYGVFKNIMTWQYKGGQWKVNRVISVDH